MTDTDLRVLILTKVLNYTYYPNLRMFGTPKKGEALTWSAIIDPDQAPKVLTDLNAAFAALEAWIEQNGGRGKACYSIGTPCNGPKFLVTLLSGIDRPIGSIFSEDAYTSRLEYYGGASADTLPRAICLALAEAVKEGA
jgi:hypothetical protein